MEHLSSEMQACIEEYPRCVGTGFADHSRAFIALTGFQHTLSWPLLFH